MELGKKIKYYRNEKSLTQDNLAERIFVSRQTISNWENDKSYPDISSIILLSEVLEVSVDNLIKGDVEQMKVEIKIEQIKKNHNIQSYKEIVAFTEGKRLDELKQIEENAKRPYQKILSVLLTVFITLFICGFMYIIFR